MIGNKKLNIVNGGSKIGLRIGYMLLLLLFFFILSIFSSGAYFLNFGGSKIIIDKIFNNEDNPITIKIEDEPIEFQKYFTISGIMHDIDELYLTTGDDKAIYLVRKDNGYLQFYMRDQDNIMNIHPNSLYRLKNNCRYMLSYFDSGIEENDDLNNYISLNHGSFSNCEILYYINLIDKIKSKHPENTLTKDEMKEEIINYFLDIINVDDKMRKVTELNDNFNYILNNFINGLDSCNLYSFKDIEILEEFEETINVQNIKNLLLIIIILLLLHKCNMINKLNNINKM
jgi:hypothetical protein